MAENVVLQLILDGISTLETKADLDAVRDAVKDRRDEIRNLAEEVVALARGNSEEKIRVNKERFDYSNVLPKDLPMAEKWYMAPQPSWKLRSAYHQWRVWNAGKAKHYKGHLIIEKATGRSVTPPQWEEEEVAGASGEDDDEVGEAAEAMAAVRVK